MAAGPLIGAVLAAGASRRMRGADKLLELIDGAPLIRRSVTAAIEALPKVLVTLPPDADARREALRGLDVRLLTVRDAADGMSASLRTAATAAMAHHGGDAGLLVTLADMPEIGADHLSAMRRAWEASDGETVLRAASADGRPGQPVIFPARLLPSLASLEGDVGGRSVIAGQPRRLVMLPGEAALVDLDTPEAWARWRAGRQRG